MTEPLTREERDQLLRMLVMQARVAGQSIMDCSRRGTEMKEQLEVARAKESGCLKLIQELGSN